MEWVTDTPLLKTLGLINWSLHGLAPIIPLCPCTVNLSSLQTRNSTPALTPYAYLGTVPQILAWLPSPQDSGLSWGVPHHNGVHLLLSPSQSLRVPAS